MSSLVWNVLSVPSRSTEEPCKKLELERQVAAEGTVG